MYGVHGGTACWFADVKRAAYFVLYTALQPWNDTIRQCLARYMLSPVCTSVSPSVCHTGGSVNCFLVFHTTLHMFLSHFYLQTLNILIIWATDVTTLKRSHKSIAGILSSDNCINTRTDCMCGFYYALVWSCVLSTVIKRILYCIVL